MLKQSAGILLYRLTKIFEVFLVHPGGPYFINKDAGVWTIPKGEFIESENALDAALREVKEETGLLLENKTAIALSPVRQKSGKTVHAWAIEGNICPETLVSNTFKIEWPPRSGTVREFPEIDKGAWFNYPDAINKINPAQILFIHELKKLLKIID